MRDFLRLLDPKGWAALIAVILLLGVGLFVLGKCSRGDEVREAQNAKAMGEARTESAVNAINEIGRLNERGQATDKEVADAQDAIRQAAPADRDAVARDRLCRLQQRPDCNRVQ
jgi:hypothetical protein